jgi:hypothetical protein
MGKQDAGCALVTDIAHIEPDPVIGPDLATPHFMIVE